MSFYRLISRIYSRILPFKKILYRDINMNATYKKNEKQKSPKLAVENSPKLAVEKSPKLTV